MASACPSGLHSRHVSSTDPAAPPCGACRHTHTRPLPLLPVSCRSQMRAVPSLDALASRLLVGHLRERVGSGRREGRSLSKEAGSWHYTALGCAQTAAASDCQAVLAEQHPRPAPTLLLRPGCSPGEADDFLAVPRQPPDGELGYVLGACRAS